MKNIRNHKAKLILLQIEAIQSGNYDNRTGDLLLLINEVFKDSKELASEIVAENEKEAA